MREILFRAKRKNWQEFPKEEWWVEGCPVKYQPCASKDEWIYGIVPTYASALYIIEIDPETICQYTGLKDKNGKRIWENDIVSAWSEGKYATGMVKQRIDGLYIIYPAYQHNEFWGLCPDKNRKTNVEVIGNVFDDKHLLADTDYFREQEKETEDNHEE